jgi:phosphoribosyl 1,2-cyclic phosphate phosphodiesterase
MNSTRLKIRILGCGSSTGVPRAGGDWGACDPTEPKNRRRRCSIFVQQHGAGGSTDVLIDTSPDLREQLLDAGAQRLDAVLFTHDHADQCHGIDDLRGYSYLMEQLIEVYFNAETASTLKRRFGYCFSTPHGSGYPPILKSNIIEKPYQPFALPGPGGVLTVTPFDQEHGRTRSLGFRMGPVAYSPDVNGIPEEGFAALEGVELWIVDALRHVPHPTHAHVDLTLEWIARVKPKRAILTDLHCDLDYATLKAALPAGVEPAYDGMVLEI